MTQRVQALRFILGDQLTPGLAGLRGGDPASDIILMAEVLEETNYAPHHRKKIALIFAAMRAFAQDCREAGWQVDYITLDDPDNTGSFGGELHRALARHNPARVVLTEASEHRVLEMQRRWSADLAQPVSLLADDRFICSLPEFRHWAQGRKTCVMEHFYRDMRRRTGLLMEGDQPAGGRWNYDHDNRKPARADLLMVHPPRFEPDATTLAVLDMVEAHCGAHFGDLRPFWFAVRRDQAEAARDHFMTHNLPRFGLTQDAMLTGQDFLHHAVLSYALNIGLLDPMDVCRRAEAEWRAGRAPIESVEGFVRQILGWREYVRGVYWLNMPGYTDLNALNAKKPLPDFYWTGNTKMACMKAVIQQTRRQAYAHHIQRLMVTGNFALLAGIDPGDVHAWYLGVYADAFEWVEAPNTLGMALYADGGLMASKPYAASGAYINKMSDYCRGCAYDPAIKTGPNACPFNPLYWQFIGRNEDTLARNPRLGPVYATWRKMTEARKHEIDDDCARIHRALDQGTL